MTATQRAVCCPAARLIAPFLIAAGNTNRYWNLPDKGCSRCLKMNNLSGDSSFDHIIIVIIILFLHKIRKDRL